MDVLTVLDVLTAVAIQIELSVDWLYGQFESFRSASSASVRADLKFRLYVHEPSKPIHDSGSALGRSDVTKPQHSGRWQGVDALNGWAFAFDDLSAVDWLWPHRHGCLWIS